MENIPHNKANFFEKHNVKFDVTKAKDVLGKDSVRARDILNNKTGDRDVRINKMSDVFPKSNNNGNDMLS